MKLLDFFMKIKLVHILLLVSVLAIWKGSRALDSVAYVHLENDAKGYAGLAKHMEHPYDTGEREPVWIWVVKGFQLLIGESHLSMRLGGILIFSLNTLLIALLAFSITDRLILGFLAGFFYLARPFNSWLAVEFMRDNFVLTVFLLIANLLFSVKKGRFSSKFLIVSVTIISVLAIGSRAQTILPVTLVGLWIFYIHRVALWKIILPISAAAIIITPHLLNNKKVFNEYTYSLNKHIRVFANFEASSSSKDCHVCVRPSKPISEITGLYYVFDRPISNLFERLYTGYYNLLFLPNWSSHLYRYLILAGYIGLLISGHWKIFIVTFLFLNLTPFTQPIHMPYRVFNFIEPMRAIAASIAVSMMAWCLRFATLWISTKSSTCRSYFKAFEPLFSLVILPGSSSHKKL